MGNYRLRVKGLRPTESWIHLAEAKFEGDRAVTAAEEERIRVLSSVKNFYKAKRDTDDFIVVGDTIIRMSGFISVTAVIEKDY